MANKNGGFIGTDGLDAPDPPTAVTPTAGDGQLSIAFTAPTDTGTSAITGFVAQVASSGDNYSAGSNTGTSSPIVVSSLSNGTSYTAKVWAINAYGTSAPSEASSGVAPTIGTRGLIASGGSASGAVNTITFLTIATSGSDTDFGDTSDTTTRGTGLGSSTRGIFFINKESSNPTTSPIEYVTFTTTGNTTDFGDMTVMGGRDTAAASNETRGLFMGQIGETVGISTSRNTIAYITIASAGNAQDFGDLTRADNDSNTGRNAALASTTRAVLCGGGASTPESNIMDYVTIGSTGNATDFGDLNVGMNNNAAVSSNTRGVIAAGLNSGNYNNTIDYITIASTGNASDFGDMTLKQFKCANGNLSNKTIGMMAGGNSESADYIQQISYITIASTGNSADFGDLGQGRDGSCAASNSHGGIS